jgi:hypothetical protein
MDLIILVIFLICIAYVFVRVREALDEQTKIEFDKDGLDAQLKERTLGETTLDNIVELTFKVKPTDRFSFNYKGNDEKQQNGSQPKFLELVINNKSEHVNIYVDWERSSLTDYGDAARRVIRLNPAKQLSSLALPPSAQAPSVVAPKTKLTAAITTEDLLKPNEEKTALEPAAPIINIAQIRMLSRKKGTDKIPPLIAKQRQFYDERQPIEFFLSLILRMADFTDPDHKERTYRLRYRLTVTRMLWSDRLPWNPK